MRSVRVPSETLHRLLRPGPTSELRGLRGRSRESRPATHLPSSHSAGQPRPLPVGSLPKNSLFMASPPLWRRRPAGRARWRPRRSLGASE
eukprot:6345610-Prymnesium_polylepis.1